MEKNQQPTFTADQDFAFWSSSSSSSSLSIGKNSDDEQGGEAEVESPFKGPLDMMESLEDVLPVKKGISKFYKGKSKSFTSLSEAASFRMKDLAKRENYYSRRRRNLLCHRICHRGGISKKPIKKVLAMAIKAMTQRERDSSSSGDNKNNKGSSGNCVPVVDSSRCFQTATSRNIRDFIC